MKSIVELNETKVPVVRKDLSLNQYSNQVLFPDKVEKAGKAFEKLGLPDRKKNSDNNGTGASGADK